MVLAIGVSSKVPFVMVIIKLYYKVIRINQSHKLVGILSAYLLQNLVMSENLLALLAAEDGLLESVLLSGNLQRLI